MTDDEPERLFTPHYHYQATVVRIIDGDTVDLLVDLGFYCFQRIRVRVKDIDAPEVYRPRTLAEAEHGQQAKAFVEQAIPVGSLVAISSFKAGAYSRWDAVIYYRQDGKTYSLAEQLRERGLAKLAEYRET